MVKAPKNVVVSFFIVVVLFVSAIVLSSCLCKDISNDGGRADDVRKELGDVSSELEKQREILIESQDAVSNSERAAGELERITQDDARIIGECRAILEKIRERAKT